MSSPSASTTPATPAAKPQAAFRETVGRFRCAVLACPALKPRDKLVALVMLERVNRQMFEALGLLLTWTGVEAVARLCALSTRDVERARSALLAAGVIVRDRAGGRGQPTRMRLCLDWLEREDGPAGDAPDPSDDPSPDSGVADARVGQSAERPPTAPASPAGTGLHRPTPVSAKPCDKTREPTRASPHASAGTSPPPSAADIERDGHARIARRIGAVQHATWFRGCRLGLSGDRRLTITAPNRCVADRIRAAYELELLRLFHVEAVDITVAVPPVAADSAFLLIEGRA